MVSSKSEHSCGFCVAAQKYVSVDCEHCAVNKIYDLLEKITVKNTFDHDHQYRQDDDEFLHNCGHCEHGYFFEERYLAADWNTECYCDVLESNTGEDGKPLMANDVCTHWRRAVDRTPRGGTPCDTL